MSFSDKSKKHFINTILCLISIIFIALTLNILVNNNSYYGKTNLFLTVVGVIIAIFILYRLYLIIPKDVSKKKERIILLIFFTAFIIIQLIFAKNLAVKPSWDFGNVYDTAVSFANTGHFDNMEYYVLFPNNIGLMLLLSIFFRVFSLIGIHNYYYLGVILNMIFISFSILFLYLLIKKKINSKMALLSLIVSLLILPFYTYAPIFYTDTISLPFMILIFYLIECVDISEKKVFMKVLYYIVTAVVLFIGYKIKITIIIMMLALLIYNFLFSKHNTKKIIIVLLIVIPFHLLFSKIVINNLNSHSNLEPFPYAHWIMMGMNKETFGIYNDNDYKLTLAAGTKKEKEAIDLLEIKRRLGDFGTIGYLKFLSEKAGITWGDGTYFAPEKLSRLPIEQTVLHQFFLSNGKYFNIYYTYSQVIQVIFISSIPLTALLIIKKRKYDIVFPVLLAILGIFLFLLIWETRSRYLVNFIPLFIFNVVIALEYVFEKMNKFILSFKKK